MEQKARKHDVIVIVVLLAAALLAYGGIRIYQNKSTQSGVAVVTLDGDEIGRYPLNQNLTMTIQVGEDDYNILEIADGKAQITEASCPDKICVNHRAVSKNHQTIVCLPNKMTVEILNQEETGVDTVTN